MPDGQLLEDARLRHVMPTKTSSLCPSSNPARRRHLSSTLQGRSHALGHDVRIRAQPGATGTRRGDVGPSGPDGRGA